MKCVGEKPREGGERRRVNGLRLEEKRRDDEERRGEMMRGGELASLVREASSISNPICILRTCMFTHELKKTKKNACGTTGSNCVVE